MYPKKWWQILLLAPVVLALVVAGLLALAIALIYPSLPSLEALTDYHPKQPLRVYAKDGALLGEFGEERRAFINIEDVPQNMKSAVLAIEDRRFYSHGGVDTKGVVRAIVTNLSGGRKEGASTITMQVARNFFLSSERSFKRKVNEALLAIKIENNLSKDQILELYINQIYLGQRSYGFAAASQIYFGKSLNELSLAESALLAGLPKAPSSYNPFVNPKRAIARQQEVLRDMHRFGFIDEAVFNKAINEPLTFKSNKKSVDLTADYVAEIVRQDMYDRYQDAIYSSGLKVYTTITKANQDAANKAVLEGLLEFDARHGYRGPEKVVTLSGEDLALEAEAILDPIQTYNLLMPALVVQADANVVKVIAKNGNTLLIKGDGLSLVKKALVQTDKQKPILKAGAVVRVINTSKGWRIVQLPEVESALVAMDPKTGAISALVGGFSFNRNKFNHVTQAWRQPGSTFKPFVYSAALEKGVTPASMFEDEPISMIGGDGKLWEPKNYDGGFSGTISVRTALTKSKNMVSIRILQRIGPSYAQDFITRFGFSAKDHPAYLTMALGAGSVTPWQMVNGYAVFANGGHKVKPYLIEKIVDSRGKLIEQARPVIAGINAPKAIDRRNAFIMTSMMKDVVSRGTAVKAKSIGRGDLAGKTGTTNDQYDAWFAGYNPNQLAVVWIGYDKPKSLGKDETGGKAALPIWISYMTSALKKLPETEYQVPEGVRSIKIDPWTGTSVIDEEDEGRYEYFYHEYPPHRMIQDNVNMSDGEDITTQSADSASPDDANAEADNKTNPSQNADNQGEKTSEPAKSGAKPNAGGAWPPPEQLF